MDRDIYWEMSEFIRDNLFYTYHVYKDKLISDDLSDDTDYSHEHTFEAILIAYVLEPEAIYLTDEDKKWYSEQELRILDKLQKSLTEVYKKHSNLRKISDNTERINALLAIVEQIQEDVRLGEEYGINN